MFSSLGDDDDNPVSEKKSHQNKKSVSQQSSIERADSIVDHSLLTPTRITPQELLTPTQLDQFAPHIPVGNKSLILPIKTRSILASNLCPVES